jgi:hypothetical protein
MGGHWAVSHVFHLEGRPWHVAVDDFIHATTTAIRRDAKDQRSLSLQCLWNRTAHGDGTRRRPATAKALHGRHGSHGSRGSVTAVVLIALGGGDLNLLAGRHFLAGHDPNGHGAGAFLLTNNC